MEKSIPASLRSAVRKLDRRREKEVLPAPNAILEQKACRLANYELAKAETSKWEGAVMRNRLADHLVFPMLPSQRITMPESNEERRHRGNLFVKDALKRAEEGSSDLDAKIFSKLYSGKAAEKFMQKAEAVAADSGDEGDIHEKKTLQERLADLRVLKVKQGQITAKLRQRAKIRSKNFHRHLKRQKIAQDANDLKLLSSTDPEAFKEKLEALQKRRIEERMTQRHRQGGRWARQAAALAKSGGATDSLDAMQDLAQQLLKKGPTNEEDEMEEGEEDAEGWITVKRSTASNKGVDDAWNAKRKDLPNSVNTRGTKKSQFALPQDIQNEEMEAEENEEEDDDAGLRFETTRRTEVEDFDNMEDDNESSPPAPSRVNVQAAEKKIPLKKAPSGPVVISLSGPLPTPQALGSTEAGALDPGAALEAELEEMMGEQEDVEADFEAEKAQQEKEEQPADLDAFRPGWNTWTGPGINKAKEEKKRQKFILRAPKVERRDSGQRRVVISEKRTNKAYRKHQPREIPFPYPDAESWEKALNRPVGRLWVTEAAHRELVRPRVATKMGQIIGPLTSGHLVRRDKGHSKKVRKDKDQPSSANKRVTGKGPKRLQRQRGAKKSRSKKK